MNSPKILIAAPSSEYKDYCLKPWIKQLKGITYENITTMIVDNSKNETYQLKYRQLGVDIVRYHAPKSDIPLRQTMAECNNIIRDYFLENQFDYLFSLETDMFVPSNIIEHLLSKRKRVIGCPYFIMHSYWRRLIPFELEDFGYSSLSMCMSSDKAFNVVDGKRKSAYQLGLGCILIHKSVIEKIPFRVELDDDIDAHADTYFHVDLKKHGITCYMDTSVIPHHANGNWFKVYKDFGQPLSKQFV